MSDEPGSSPAERRASPAHAGPEHIEPSGFQREVWGTRLGFVLAATGSAVGLGNMWRFPYLTAERGGAAFVLVFIVILVLVGIPILLAEFNVGRRTGLSPIGALRASGGRAWAPLGYFFVATGMLILAYYSVIAGWVTRYAIQGLLAGFPTETGLYFSQISQGFGAIGYHLFFMTAVVAIVMVGIEKGIERASLFMMPLLFLLVIGIAVYATTLPGSGPGYSFYLTPDLRAAFSLGTIAAAAGQAFFTLSLGMGAMLTFASYLAKKESLPREAVIISGTDFSVAFVAGLAVFPIIFAFGLQDQVGASTVGALFISLPRAFAEMGSFGRAAGVAFFVTLFIGAITSAISLLEVVTASLIDEWGVKRKFAAAGAGVIITLIGFWPAMDLDILSVMDEVAGQLFLVIGALMLSVFVGWRLRDPLAELLVGTSPGARLWLLAWLWTLRIIVPALLLVVLWQSGRSAVASIVSLFSGG
ncbi:MAG TPA: sodium-dependent transporter [Longimicrobiales bacterium]|nr:sodium-dependent transporter [Longimicrobiales bacterium]